MRLSGTQWEELVLDEDKEGEDEISEQIQQLYRILRQELKEGDKDEVCIYLQKEKLQQKVIDALIRRAQGMLSFYKAFSFLRNLEKRNEDALKGMLASVYQKYIVRYEPGYLNQMVNEKYDKERLTDVVNRINYLTEFYVSRSYNVFGMMRDLQDETGLSWESCEYWAELIDQNYQVLKMNYILEELKEIRRMNGF